MSKKVITFLVVLFVITAAVIFVAKKSSAPPAADTHQEAAADTGKDKASDAGGKDDSIVGNDDAISDSAGASKKEAAPAADKAGDKKADAKTDDAAKPADDADKKTDAAPVETTKESDAKPVEEPAAKPAEEKPAAEAAAKPASSDTSLLAPSAAMDIDMDNALAERAVGDPDAPVTVIEYASMTCPHCARFSNDIFEQVNDTLIKPGKLRLIFRDYPLDTYALKASMMARCTDRSKYFNLISVIFKNQERWVKSTDPLASLKQLGALAGMDDDFITSCLANSELQQFILTGMQDAQTKYHINATPTFVFNNGAEQISGDQTLDAFQKIVDKLIAKKGGK